MLSKKFCVFAIAVYSMTAGARGGLHDGGGQGVIRTGQEIEIADRYAPVNARGKFQPEGQPTKILEGRDEVKRQLDLFEKVLLNYGGSMPFNRKAEAQKFYLVPALPDVADCQVARNNSGVPRDAKVIHLACTQGDVTLLVDNAKVSVRRLEDNHLADLIAHELMRALPQRMDTFSLETIVRGLSFARDIEIRQKAGERKLIVGVELEALQHLADEVPQTQLGSKSATGSIRIWPNGGGLLVDCPEGQTESAFVSAASTVTRTKLGAGTQVIGSTLDSRAGAAVEANVVIEDSNVSVADGFRIGGDTHVSGSQIWSRGTVTIGAKTIVKRSKIVAHEVKIGTNSVIEESTINSGCSWFCTKLVEIGDEVRIRRTSIALGAPTLLSFETPIVTGERIGNGAVLEDSRIELTKMYVQGEMSKVSGLRLRVRPLKQSDNLNWDDAFADVEVAVGVQVRGASRPLVLLSQYSYLPGQPVVSFGETLDMETVKVCAQTGYDKATQIETGVAFSRLKLTPGANLSSCTHTEPLKEWGCSGHFGCWGYKVPAIF